MSKAVSESSPLLDRGAGDVKQKPAAFAPSASVWAEFVSLTSMAAQVSLATLARIALTSIDAIFLGHLGVKQLAAASLAQVWTSPPLMAVWASASALITLCGQSWGADNRELTGVWLQFGLLLVTVLSVPVFIWYWCIGVVLEYSTDDPEVIELSARFARVLSGAVLPSLVYSCLRQYFQAMGIILPTTFVGLASIAVAITGNYVFIYGGPFGWNGLGFIGSPLSTVLASWFQPCALAAYCCAYKGYHRRAWGGWRRSELTLDRLRVFASIAGPIACNSFASNLANALISLVAAKLGAEAIAANAVVAGMWGMLWALFWGYGCATQVRVANYLGAGQPRHAKRVVLLGLACTVIVVAALAVVTSAFDEGVVGIYTNDAKLLATCRRVLPVFVAAFVIEAVEMVLSGVLTGMSLVRVTMVTSIVATWLVNLPIAYIGGLTLGMGFPALWCGVLGMETFKLGSYTLALSRVRWDGMAERAMSAMRATPEETAAEVEKSAVNYITAVVGSRPTGYIAAMPEPRTPPLTAPYARQKGLGRIQRRCSSFEPPSSSSVVFSGSASISGGGSVRPLAMEVQRTSS